MLCLRRSAILLALLLAVAPAARAANQQYQGSLVIESFGNDALTAVPGIFTVFGMPQGVQCNPYQPRCPIASTPTTSTPMGAKVFAPLGLGCAKITYFGVTMHPAKGATPMTGLARNVHYRNPNFFTPGGAPNVTVCTGTSTAGGGMATMFLTTNSPLRGKVMKGAPLTGEQIVTLTAMTGPAGWVMKAAPTAPVKVPGPTGFGIRRTTSGEFNNIFPYLYSYTYATLRNDAGGFYPGNGPGNFNVKYYDGAKAVAQVKVTAGSNQFGGVMRLLGQLTTRVCYFRVGGCSLGGNNWRYDAVGAAAYKNPMGTVTGGYIATYVAKYYHTNLMQQNTIIVSGSRFSWTTGTASVTAKYRGPHRTVEVRKGYDNRTALGKGNIQLVTPVITRWLLPGFDFETGGVGVMRLAFVPEPAKWLLLVAGLSVLGILYRVRGR